MARTPEEALRQGCPKNKEGGGRVVWSLPLNLENTVGQMRLVKAGEWDVNLPRCDHYVLTKEEFSNLADKVTLHAEITNFVYKNTYYYAVPCKLISKFLPIDGLTLDQ